MPDPTYFTCTLGQAALHNQNDEFTNINDLIQHNSEQFADLPAAGFYLPSLNPSGAWSHRVFTFAEVYEESLAAASTLSQSLQVSERGTVALLCPSTADFLFTWLALIRLGRPALLIAPQCSPEAIAELCKQCEARHVLFDDIYKELMEKSIEATRKIDFDLELHPLTTAQGTPNKSFPLAPRILKDDIAYLHHTSGTSSGKPKPIPQSHHAGAGGYARFDGSQAATFTTTPLYHGGIADLFRAWTSHAPIWLFPGKDIPITATNIVKCLETSKRAGTPTIRYFSSVPYVLQMMASDPFGLENLRRMDVVGVGGAALPKEVGDFLVEENVSLISRFGSAECGFLLSSHREYEKDKEWQYLRSDEGAENLKFEERDQGLYELVILPGWPHISKTNREDGSFATFDLFERHPLIPNAWRYHSRADSQLTLITGKKFDPAPVEDAITAGSEFLQDALIFGDGRPYPGVLLFRSPEAVRTPDEDLLQQIISVVQKLNRGSQDHARIPQNMLVLMPYVDSPLEKSSKGTILRRKAEEKYAAQIEQAYDQMSFASDEVPDCQVEGYILDVVKSISVSHNSQEKGEELGLDTDLFAYGLDSIACVQIHHAVKVLLPVGAPHLPLTVVQDTGSMRKLAERILKVRRGGTIPTTPQEDQSQLMEDMVEESSHLDTNPAILLENFVSTPPRSPSTTGKIVLLTGPTGSLGSHLLSQLVESPHVSHIHLLLRGATQQAAEERVKKALASRKLPIHLDFNSKVSIHTCSIAKLRLGLSVEIYRMLAQEVNIIFHLAWSVDFILPLQGFKQHFAGLRSLLELSLAHARCLPIKTERKAAEVIFCSSTASVASYQNLNPGRSIPEEMLTDPSVSGNIGYSQSKWIAENICSTAANTHPELSSAIKIVRVGQLSGDSLHGVWNKSEAYPLLLSSAKATGCLPDLPNESAGWVPVDVAAKAFLELGMRNREAEDGDAGVKVYHLLNQDQRTTWRMLLEWIKDREPLQIVDPSDWLRTLGELERDEALHPCLKLLDFWKRAYGEQHGKSVEQVRYDVKQSIQAMPVLGEVGPVREEYAVKLWLWTKENV